MIPRISRSQAVFASSAILLVGRTSVRAQGLTPLRFGCFPVINAIPAIRAFEAGLFRDVGIDLIPQKINSGSAVAAALVGGAIDIGIVSAVPVINARERGVPLSVVAHSNVHMPGAAFDAGVIASVSSPIRTYRDLDGKTVAIAALKDTNWLAIRSTIDAAGGNSENIHFVELPFSVVLAACEAGRIDAGATVEPFISQAVKSGRGRSIGDEQAVFGRCVETLHVATPAFVEKNRELATRFARVVRESNGWCNGHRAETADVTVSFTGVDRSQLVPEATTFATQTDPRDLQPYINAAYKYGVIPRAWDAATIYARV